MTKRSGYVSQLFLAAAIGLATWAPQAAADTLRLEISNAESIAAQSYASAGSEVFARSTFFDAQGKIQPEFQTAYTSITEQMNIEAQNTVLPILFMDRDMYQLAQVAARLNAGDMDEEQEIVFYRDALGDYIESRLGVRLSLKALDGLSIRLDKGRASAALFSHDNQDLNGTGDAEVCIVTMPYPDMSMREDIVLHWLDNVKIEQGDYRGAIADAKMVFSMTKEERVKFFAYHELGHCLDRIYHTAYKDGLSNGADYREKAMAVYMSENVGDVFAALKMAQQGHTDIAPKVNALRLTAFAHVPADRYGRKPGFFWQALKAAQEYIDTADDLSGMSNDDLMNIAQQIVVDSKLSDDAILFATSIFYDPADAPKFIEEHQDDPDYKNAVDFVQSILDKSEEVLPQLFDLEQSEDLYVLGADKSQAQEMDEMLATNQACYGDRRIDQIIRQIVVAKDEARTSAWSSTQALEGNINRLNAANAAMNILARGRAGEVGVDDLKALGTCDRAAIPAMLRHVPS